jgi:multiple antibiotic resistance protein
MTASAAFLLAFPSLFSIINPIGGALIFNEFTADLAHEERVRVAKRVGFYALLVMLAALWGGAYVLNFFGVSLAALRVAGGTVVALSAWQMLSPEARHEERKRRQTEGSGSDPLEAAFFPLTMPLTTGPGTIAVAIALGAERPASSIGLLTFFVGVSAAAAANAAVVWLAYRSADRITGMMSPSARNILSRLTAFLLLCIGAEILLDGITDVMRGLHPLR